MDFHQHSANIAKQAALGASPKRARNRHGHPMGFSAKGMLTLAQFQDQYGRADTALGYLGTEYSINQILLEMLARVRQVCLNEYRRNPVLRRVVESYLSGVIGKGSALKVEGTGGEAVTMAWRDFAKSVNLDGRGFNELERQAVRSLLISGEFLAVIRRTQGGLKTQMLDPRRLPVRLNETLGTPRGGGQIAMGIELNGADEVVAYHLTKPTRNFQHDALSTDVIDTERFSAENVIYIANKEYPEQLRGIPILASVVGRAANIDQYGTVEIQRANINARNAGYISAPAEDGEALDSDDEFDGYSVIEDDAFHLRELPDGATVTPAQNTHPSGQYKDFMDSQKADIAAGSGALSLAEVSGDYSKVNFSSARMARLAAQPTFEYLREMIVCGLHDRLFDECVKMGVARGELGPSALRRKPMWRFPAPAAIQPREQAMADHQSLVDGIKSPSQIMRERGLDPAEVRAEIAEDMAWYREQGLQYPGEKVVQMQTKEGSDAAVQPQGE